MFTVVQASLQGARDENQDRVSHFDSPFGHVFVLADGMGGYQGGGIAAQIATTELSILLAAQPDSMAPQAALVEAIEELNRTILHESRTAADTAGMGSTLAVLLVRDTADGSFAVGAHVGDSRIYFLRTELFCVTRDHTVVARLVDSGLLSPEEAGRHPDAGVLTRALGRQESVSVDLTPWIHVQAGDVFMLCSDGLSGYADDDEILQAMRSGSTPQAMTDALVALAQRVHSEDNISVLLVRADAAAGVEAADGEAAGRAGE